MVLYRLETIFTDDLSLRAKPSHTGSSLSCPFWTLRVFKTSTAKETLTHHQVQLPGPSTAPARSGPQLLLRTDPEEMFHPEDFTFMMLVSF